MSEQEINEITESVVKRVAVSEQLKKTKVYVTLDTRRSGVEVPEEFKGRAMLTLLLGNDLAVPIPDLDVGEKGITATLSFGREPFRCVIPWDAIYALSSDGNVGILFHQSKPDDVNIGASKPATPKLEVLDGDCTAEPVDGRPKPALKLV